jgi:transcriptional regulator with XRE-family HTH domain
MIKSTTNIDGDIGNKISDARKLKNISRKILAEKIGITHQQLHKYETGVNRISASRLLQIANILNLDVSYFYPISDFGYTSSKDADYGLDEISLLLKNLNNKKKIIALKNLIMAL